MGVTQCLLEACACVCLCALLLLVVSSAVMCALRAFLDLACAHSDCSSPWFAGGLVCSWHVAAVCFEVFLCRIGERSILVCQLVAAVELQIQGR